MHSTRYRWGPKGRIPATAAIMPQSPSLIDRGFGGLECSVDRSSANIRRGSSVRASPVNHQVAEAQPVQGVGVGPGQLFEGLDMGVQLPAAIIAHAPAPPPPIMQAAPGQSDDTKKLKATRDYRKSMEPFVYVEGEPIRIKSFEVLSRLGKGGFSTVFKALDRSTNKHVALKISTKPMYTCDDDEVAVHLIDKPDFHKKLHNDVWEMRCFNSEIEAFKKLGCCGGPEILQYGFPQMHDYGLIALTETRVHAYMVMSLLGEAIDKEVSRGTFVNSKWQFKRTAHGMLTALENMHVCGLVHRDIKPGNFCLPLAGMSQESDVYLLDFGFAREMPNPADPPKPGSFVGTPDYASSNALSSVAQSARDDLESLAYTLLEMYEGVLVWDVTYFNDWPNDKYKQGIRNQNRRNMTEPQLLDLLDSHAVQNREIPIDWTPDNLKIMRDLRDASIPEKIKKACMPRFICDWLDYIKTLPPGVRPNYEFLRTVIDSCDKRHGSSAHVADYAAHLTPAPTSGNVGSKRGRSDTDVSADSNDWDGETCGEEEEVYSSQHCEDDSEEPEEVEDVPDAMPVPPNKKARLFATMRED